MIKIYQQEKFEFNKSEKILNLLKNKQIKMGLVMFRAQPIMEVITGIIIAGFIYYTSIMVSTGEIEINNFFSFLTAMMLAYQPIRSLATINMLFYQGAAAAERVFEVIDTKSSIEQIDRMPNLKIGKGSIEFKDVNYSYPKTKEHAVKNINISIEGNTIAALVGHSGAGKSTIINLLPRFYDPQNGKILIDDQDIREVNLNSLRKNISLVSQDIILFDDTIWANIAYANSSATDKEIVKACEFAAADEFIKKLPDEYNTMIGENGIRLSGGQKQRISIARAILKHSPIILLDEATSSLDAESEKIVQDAITNLTKDKTTLVIAHRLSTIHNADKIFVLKNGLIIDSGVHENLIKNCNEYKALFFLLILVNYCIKF